MVNGRPALADEHDRSADSTCLAGSGNHVVDDLWSIPVTAVMSTVR